MTSPLGEIITLPRITDPRGNLTVAEQLRHIPFEIKRVYWTYDVPAGVSGSFDVVLDNGKERRTYHMNHPYQALLIHTGIWRTLEDFSSGAVCLSLASDEFEEEDYIRDYEAFLTYLKCSK